MAKGNAATAEKGKPGRRAGKSAVDPNETKAQKFVRLGVPRVTRAIKAIGAIGNLGGSGYESTPEQQEKIIAALRGAVDSVEKRLAGNTTSGPAFTL